MISGFILKCRSFETFFCHIVCLSLLVPHFPFELLTFFFFFFFQLYMCFFLADVVNNILKTKEFFTVPVTTAEFAVMKTACSVWPNKNFIHFTLSFSFYFYSVNWNHGNMNIFYRIIVIMEFMTAGVTFTALK